MKITRVVDIEAAPEKVFDLIARVEDFTSHSPLITEIERLSPTLYRWRAAICGIRLEWDAEVVHFDRPRHFGWESVRGVRNSGEYRLEAYNGGTRVSFTMEYHLPCTLLERLTGPFLDELTQGVAQDILDNVKRRLEENMNGAEQSCQS